MSESEPLQISPFCRRLRSKKIYFLAHPPRREDEVLDGSGSCWCQLTQDGVGPDGELVDPEDCRAQRACFESLESSS